MTDDLAAKPVQKIKYQELAATPAPDARKVLNGALNLIQGVKVHVQANIGQCEITVRDLLELKESSVLTLDKTTRDPIDLIIDGRVVAHGTLVVVGDYFGVRITQGPDAT